ncbi:glycosyltransferase [Breoghania sp.]|uniref:glycosyltransferase n=1 Tax=Breoghania sp. TaxID=2065378 RepID=UPI002623E53D|nr:glycosyltransferase [Breoghania sp.]MDJ0930821.1 glycosyltransferase [Breoghania sp.]
MPSGVDTRRFTPREKTPNSFIAIGRLIAKKRPDITVRALCQAARSCDDATLTVIGAGEMRNECEEIVRKEGMTERVHFLGELSHQEVCEHLAASEYFLQYSVTSPSGDTEGTPTSIQEALSAGCVVISTRHASIPDLISEGETDFLVAERDEAAFRDRIAEAMSRRIDVEKMSANSRNYVLEHLDTEKLYRQLEEIMSAAVGNA